MTARTGREPGVAHVFADLLRVKRGHGAADHRAARQEVFVPSPTLLLAENAVAQEIAVAARRRSKYSGNALATVSTSGTYTSSMKRLIFSSRERYARTRSIVGVLRHARRDNRGGVRELGAEHGRHFVAIVRISRALA